jgi:hypothetical protein
MVFLRKTTTSASIFYYGEYLTHYKVTQNCLPLGNFEKWLVYIFCDCYIRQKCEQKLAIGSLNFILQTRIQTEAKYEIHDSPSSAIFLAIDINIT